MTLVLLIREFIEIRLEILGIKNASDHSKEVVRFLWHFCYISSLATIIGSLRNLDNDLENDNFRKQLVL